jgi:hypothetical protein
MADQSMQPEENRAGSSDHEQHRTPEGEGSEATMASEEAGPAELTVFDGKGNEQVMITTDGEEGTAVQGTGDTAEEAMKDAKKGGPIGPGVGH